MSTNMRYSIVISPSSIFGANRPLGQTFLVCFNRCLCIEHSRAQSWGTWIEMLVVSEKLERLWRSKDRIISDRLIDYYRDSLTLSVKHACGETSCKYLRTTKGCLILTDDGHALMNMEVRYGKH